MAAEEYLITVTIDGCKTDFGLGPGVLGTCVAEPAKNCPDHLKMHTVMEAAEKYRDTLVKIKVEQK